MNKPIYQQLADQLRSEIHEGKYPAGGELPSERELAKMLSTTRDTVRDALRVLASEGLIMKRGVGQLAMISANLGRVQVLLPPGAYVTARVANAEDRRTLSLPPDITTPLVEVVTKDGAHKLYAGREIEIATVES